MTDLFAAAARLELRALLDAIPPSVRREVDAVPVTRRDGEDVLLELGPWTPRRPAHHLVPSLALLTARPYSVRFELAGARAGTWSRWVATATLGADVFAPLSASADGLVVDIDELRARPPLEEVRLRVRVRAPDGPAVFAAPWLATLSAWDGELRHANGSSCAPLHLAVPPRTQLTEPEAVRLRICSPTSVAMVLEYLGRPLPTLLVADEVFHAATDRYGVWPAAVRVAAAHGVPGYLLRFPDWAAAAWCLERGLPIVVSVRYTPGELTGAAIAETTGHLLVLTGLEDEDVLVNDPAAPTVDAVPRRYRRDELSRAWLDRSGMGYVFFPLP